MDHEPGPRRLRIDLAALLLAGMLALLAMPARAALSELETQVLREGHRVKTENARKGVGEGYYVAADKAALEKARALAARLGGQADADAMSFLATLGAHDLLNAYRDKYRGGTTPLLEQLVVRYHTEPVGLALISMLGEVNSRPLFDLLLADVKRGGLSWDVVHVNALARATLPGIEPELLPLLDAGGSARMSIARLLLTDRRYLPAVPVAARLLRTCDDTQVHELAQRALKLDPQAAMGAVVERLVAQGLRDRRPVESENVRGLAEALEWSVPPWLTVPRTAIDDGVLAKMAASNRDRIVAAVAKRDDIERRFRERTYDNFAWFATYSPRAAERFVDEGFDVKQQNARGTPLQVAMERSDLGLIAAVLKAGADANTRGYGGGTVLHRIAALSHDHDEQAVDVAQLALDRGAKVDATGYSQMTPLHQAVQAGSPRLVALLLERGASTQVEAYDTKGVMGVTPLQLAQEAKNETIVALLRTRGATLSAAYPARQAEALSAQRWKDALGILLTPLFLFAGPMH